MAMAARAPVGTSDGLMFRVTARLNQYHKVIITLTGKDLYNISLIKIARKSMKVTEVWAIEDTYAEDLALNLETMMNAGAA